MKPQKKLPLFGPGPFLVISMLLLTLAGLYFHWSGRLASGYLPQWRGLFIWLGLSSIIGGVGLWVKAAWLSDLSRYIEHNQLLTSGVYAWVRNPIYTAFMLVFAGVLLCMANVWLIGLIPIFWALVSVTLKRTEEQWLLEIFGNEYRQYCARTNRCIPWPPKQNI